MVTPLFLPRLTPGSAAALQRRLARLVLHDESVRSVHLLLARAVLDLVPGGEAASVTTIEGRTATTAASTGLMAYELDEAQYAARNGPCLEAARTGVPQVLSDVRRDLRWPDFRQTAVQQGTLSCVSVPVPAVGDRLQAAVNVYAAAPRSLDAETADLIGSLLTDVGPAVANAHDYVQAQARAANLTIALDSRAVIEQAKGVLMHRTGCTADEAFAQLSTRSQQTNTKLRALAQTVVDEACSRGLSAGRPRPPRP